MPDPSGKAHLCHVETIRKPGLYSARQIRRAFDVCFALGRGKLVLTEAPDGNERA